MQLRGSAAERRKNVATGATPWIEERRRLSPGGAKDSSSPFKSFAPPGLGSNVTVSPGLAGVLPKRNHSGSARSRGLYARVQVPQEEFFIVLERGRKARGYVQTAAVFLLGNTLAPGATVLRRSAAKTRLKGERH